jgi:hypothetical protein
MSYWTIHVVTELDIDNLFASCQNYFTLQDTYGPAVVNRHIQEK